MTGDTNLLFTTRWYLAYSGQLLAKECFYLNNLLKIYSIPFSCLSFYSQRRTAIFLVNTEEMPLDNDVILISETKRNKRKQSLFWMRISSTKMASFFGKNECRCHALCVYYRFHTESLQQIAIKIFSLVYLHFEKLQSNIFSERIPKMSTDSKMISTTPVGP